MTEELKVENVQKWLGGVQILKGCSFTADRGSIVALLGASGSGKTTLLRTVAGLGHPERGRIIIGGKTVLDNESGIVTPPEKRNIGLVFQSYALWPHKSVADNVGYGLKLRGVSAGDLKTRVQAIMDRLGLGHLGDRYPDQLSGGQQQRVAVCRALVYEPRVLLLDEPLSNLDAKLREEARYFLRRLILDLEICAVLVTHDQSEALAAADKILLLENGTIRQEGTPHEVYSNPNSFYSADFLGANNIVSGTIRGAANGTARLTGDGWDLTGSVRDARGFADGDLARAVIRVEEIRVSDTASDNAIEMELADSVYLGDKWEYRLARGSLAAKANGAAPLPRGKVWATIPQDSIWLFPANDEV